jgi:hypothetical protein
LIIAAPGMKPGKTKSLSEHLDIFPTICNLAAVAIPSQLEGKSLKPLMLDNAAKLKEFSVSQYPRKLKKEEMVAKGYAENKMMGYSIRTEKYRFTIWMNNFTTKQPFNTASVFATELYDYVKDPLEKLNVVNDKSYASISKDLYNKMLVFFKSQEKK